MAEARPDRRFWKDYLAWSGDGGAQVVTVHAVRGPSRAGSTAYAVKSALRDDIRTAQKSPSGGVYLGHESAWSLPMDLTPPDVAVLPGDEVVEPDQGRPGGELRWTVLRVRPDYVGGVWGADCIDLVMAHRLLDTVQVQRPEIDMTDAGAATKRFPPAGGRVLFECAARVQPTGERPNEIQGRRAGLRMFDVFLDARGNEIDTAEDTVYWTDRLGGRGVTRRLDIVEMITPERLEDVVCLRCEERR